MKAHSSAGSAGWRCLSCRSSADAMTTMVPLVPGVLLVGLTAGGAADRARHSSKRKTAYACEPTRARSRVGTSSLCSGGARSQEAIVTSFILFSAVRMPLSLPVHLHVGFLSNQKPTAVLRQCCSTWTNSPIFALLLNSLVPDREVMRKDPHQCPACRIYRGRNLHIKKLRVCTV